MDDLLARPRRQRRPLVLTICGVEGMGKSTLGVQWSHAVSGRFTDGQLHIDLGRQARGEGVALSDILGELLHSLGVPAESIPTGLAERLRLFRSRTADRRLLLVLDDVTQDTQVTPLLPASANSAVVVISRRRLTQLLDEGAEEVLVGPLEVSAGLQLLERMLGGDRVAAEKATATELVHRCGGMPLALRIAGGRLRRRRHWPLTKVTSELTAEDHRLGALSEAGGRDVSAVLDLSYGDLPQEAARLYRRIGLLEWSDFDPGAVAELDGLSAAETERLLETLTDHALLDVGDDGRFRIHELVRLHARACAERHDSPDERAAAVYRVVTWYLRAAAFADRAAKGERLRLAEHSALLAGWVQPFGDDIQALNWLEIERANLLTMVRTAARYGWDTEVILLCDALWALFLNRKYYADWIESHQLGVAAALRAADPRAQARLRCQLGRAYTELRDYGRAAAEYEQAESAATRSGDLRFIASAVEFTGRLLFETGDHDGALAKLTRSQELHEALGDQRGTALQRHHLARVLIRMSQPAAAVLELHTALEGMLVVGDTYNQARIQMSLGEAYRDLERYPDARDALAGALAFMERRGAPFQVGQIREALADVAAAAGERDETRQHLEEAVAAYQRCGSPDAERAQGRLERLRQ
ncbi:NB-ARC domain-containing protein (plasmid) [Streptosporangium sp. CA-135522]|uniref:NB-ARC domain-containing protein n=1 Tax=Streptosporangium sp. CA-135522 TaxID=3240072 RepID=UPI003D8A2654